MHKRSSWMTTVGMRGGAETWSDRYSSTEWGDTALRWLRNRQRVRAFLVATAFLALGMFAGLLMGRLSANSAAHQQGACIALQIATALGYLDDRQQRITMRSIATALNPDVDQFPGGHRALRQTCEAVADRR